MVGRGLLPRRSGIEWGTRCALALLASMLGYQTVTHGIALAVQRTDAVQAYRLAPSDSQIAAALAASIFTTDQSPRAQPHITDLARQALRGDPTAEQAAATLGLQEQLRGHSVMARRWFGYAQMLSRRDLQVQLWAIEDAIGRGDIPAALHQYDTALRTSNAASELLFPVLGGAIAEPDVRRGLVSTLVKKPSWATSFIEYAANAGVDPKAVATLFVDLRRAGVAVSGEATRAVITRLVQAGSPMLAWRYYATVRASVDRYRSRDPSFTAQLDVPTPFDWVVANEPGVSASIEAGHRGGLVNFSALSGVGGEVVRQMQFLPPGRYRIEGHAKDTDRSTRSTSYWTLNCWHGRELEQVVVPADKRFAGFFTVPVDCPLQMLTLVARASDAITGVSGQIDRVQLAPAP